MGEVVVRGAAADSVAVAPVQVAGADLAVVEHDPEAGFLVARGHRLEVHRRSAVRRARARGHLDRAVVRSREVVPGRILVAEMPVALIGLRCNLEPAPTLEPEESQQVPVHPHCQGLDQAESVQVRGSGRGPELRIDPARDKGSIIVRVFHSCHLDRQGEDRGSRIALAFRSRVVCRDWDKKESAHACRIKGRACKTAWRTGRSRWKTVEPT